MCYRSSHHHKWMHHPKFRHYKKHHHRGMHGRWQYPPVNVQEHDDHYQLLVYASGYQKEDFSISIVGEALVIKASGPDQNVEDTNWRRKEFYSGAFERRFQLPEGVDVEAISAKYDNGVLELTLPKQSGFETVRKSIDID